MTAYRCGDCVRKDQEIAELNARLESAAEQMCVEVLVALERNRREPAYVLKHDVPLNRRLQVFRGALSAMADVVRWLVWPRRSRMATFVLGMWMSAAFIAVSFALVRYLVVP